MKCSVAGCKGEISHFFQSNARRRSSWLKSTRLKRAPLPVFVCYKHFKENEYLKREIAANRKRNRRLRLKKKILPPVFCWDVSGDKVVTDEPNMTEQIESLDQEDGSFLIEIGEKESLPEREVSYTIKELNIYYCDDDDEDDLTGVDAPSETISEDLTTTSREDTASLVARTFHDVLGMSNVNRETSLILPATEGTLEISTAKPPERTSDGFLDSIVDGFVSIKTVGCGGESVAAVDKKSGELEVPVYIRDVEDRDFSMVEEVVPLADFSNCQLTDIIVFDVSDEGVKALSSHLIKLNANRSSGDHESIPTTEPPQNVLPPKEGNVLTPDEQNVCRRTTFSTAIHQGSTFPPRASGLYKYLPSKPVEQRFLTSRLGNFINDFKRKYPNFSVVNNINKEVEPMPRDYCIRGGVVKNPSNDVHVQNHLTVCKNVGRLDTVSVESLQGNHVRDADASLVEEHDQPVEGCCILSINKPESALSSEQRPDPAENVDNDLNVECNSSTNTVVVDEPLHDMTGNDKSSIDSGIQSSSETVTETVQTTKLSSEINVENSERENISPENCASLSPKKREQVSVASEENNIILSSVGVSEMNLEGEDSGDGSRSALEPSVELEKHTSLAESTMESPVRSAVPISGNEDEFSSLEQSVQEGVESPNIGSAIPTNLPVLERGSVMVDWTSTIDISCLEIEVIENDSELCVVEEVIETCHPATSSAPSSAGIESDVPVELPNHVQTVSQTDNTHLEIHERTTNHHHMPCSSEEDILPVFQTSIILDHNYTPKRKSEQELDPTLSTEPESSGLLNLKQCTIALERLSPETVAKYLDSDDDDSSSGTIEPDPSSPNCPVVCYHCSEALPMVSMLKHHIVQEHRDNQLTCPRCFVTFNSILDCNSHLQKEHPFRASRITYLCSHCEFATKDNSVLRSHLDMEHKLYTYSTCPLCPFKYSLNEALLTHIKKCHPDKLQINLCTQASHNACVKETFHEMESEKVLPNPVQPKEPSVVELTLPVISTGVANIERMAVDNLVPGCSTLAAKHPNQVQPARKIRCLLPVRTPKLSPSTTDASIELGTPADENLHESGKANLPVSTKDIIFLPMEDPLSVTDPLSFRTPYPEIIDLTDSDDLVTQTPTFSIKRIPNSTNRKSNTPDNFRCPGCSLVFCTVNKLTRHVLTCSYCSDDANGFQRSCPTCGKCFHTYIGLKRHINLKHTNVSCPVCRCIFSRDYIHHHMKYKHSSECFVCSACNFSTIVDAVMQLHKMVTHRIRPKTRTIFCPICPANTVEFAKLSELELHSNQRHFVVLNQNPGIS